MARATRGAGASLQAWQETATTTHQHPLPVGTGTLRYATPTRTAADHTPIPLCGGAANTTLSFGAGVLAPLGTAPIPGRTSQWVTRSLSVPKPEYGAPIPDVGAAANASTVVTADTRKQLLVAIPVLGTFVATCPKMYSTIAASWNQAMPAPDSTRVSPRTAFELATAP